MIQPYPSAFTNELTPPSALDGSLIVKALLCVTSIVLCQHVHDHEKLKRSIK